MMLLFIAFALYGLLPVPTLAASLEADKASNIASDSDVALCNPTEQSKTTSLSLGLSRFSQLNQKSRSIFQQMLSDFRDRFIENDHHADLLSDDLFENSVYVQNYLIDGRRMAWSQQLEYLATAAAIDAEDDLLEKFGGDMPKESLDELSMPKKKTFSLEDFNPHKKLPPVSIIPVLSELAPFDCVFEKLASLLVMIEEFNGYKDDVARMEPRGSKPYIMNDPDGEDAEPELIKVIVEEDLIPRKNPCTNVRQTCKIL